MDLGYAAGYSVRLVAVGTVWTDLWRGCREVGKDYSVVGGGGGTEYRGGAEYARGGGCWGGCWGGMLALRLGAGSGSGGGFGVSCRHSIARHAEGDTDAARAAESQACMYVRVLRT